MDRNEVITRIRHGLRERSGKDWSVTGGRGTAWGWIKISAPPRRCVGQYRNHMTEADALELTQLLGLSSRVQDYESVPAHNGYWEEYIDRAEGREPTVKGEPYWD